MSAKRDWMAEVEADVKKRAKGKCKCPDCRLARWAWRLYQDVERAELDEELCPEPILELRPN